MSDTVIIESDQAGTTVLLNRPHQRNALSHDLLLALAEALQSKTCSNSTRITLTGAGSVFSAGADFRELTGTLDDLRIDEDIERVSDAIRELGVVTAHINGPCMGGAVDIALACADRTGTTETLFQVPATQLSLLYNPLAVRHMVLRFGAEIVTRILADGERFDAARALQTGLVSSLQNGAVDDAAETRRPAQPTAQETPVSQATREMIRAIADDRFDLDYWQKRRREFLQSPQRLAAVEDFQRRMSQR